MALKSLLQNPAYGSSFLFSVDFFEKIIIYKSMRSKRHTAYGNGFNRKRIFQKAILAVILLLLLLLVPVVYFKQKGTGGNERKELRDSFESGNFEISYNQSGEMLREKPLDSFLLTVHGFSAYQLAIAQINSFDTLSYINDCIWALRKALLLKENSSDGRVFYVLGKAYYYKGSGYADLAINYLEKARTVAYRAADIPEYLGMAYASIKDFRSSVAAFAMALTGEGTFGSEPSDILLLSIARSYLALEETEPGQAYLIRCLETSKDSKIITTARLLLAGILFKNGEFQDAESEYLKIIDESGENAEARYQLGELYASSGDTTRARAEWRRAIRIDPAHAAARRRLNL